MHIEIGVDPRLIAAEQYEPAFQVKDWYSSEDGSPPDAETTAEITDASIWEVLEWAAQPRIPRPVASFIWAIDKSDSIRILVGVLDWSNSQLDPPARRATLPEPVTEEGWKYFTRNYGPEWDR